MTTVYDTGVLIAADSNDRNVWADHRARLEAGVVPITTAPVIAQASRSPRQAQLRRFLRGCDVVGFESGQAHEVGTLLAKSGTTDVVDAHVAVTAAGMARLSSRATSMILRRCPSTPGPGSRFDQSGEGRLATHH